MHLLGVQVAVANQFPGVQQHRNLVPIAQARRAVRIDVDHIHGHIARNAQRLKLAEHFLAEAAPGARVQQKAHGLSRQRGNRVGDEFDRLSRNLADRRDLVTLDHRREGIA